MNRRALLAMGAMLLLPRALRAQPRLPGCTFLNHFKKVTYPKDINPKGYPAYELGHRRVMAIDKSGGDTYWLWNRAEGDSDYLPTYVTKGRDKYEIWNRLETDARLIFQRMTEEMGSFVYINNESFNANAIERFSDCFAQRFFSADYKYKLTNIFMMPQHIDRELCGLYPDVAFNWLEKFEYKSLRDNLLETKRREIENFCAQADKKPEDVKFAFGIDNTLESLIWYASRERSAFEVVGGGLQLESGLASTNASNMVVGVF